MSSLGLGLKETVDVVLLGPGHGRRDGVVDQKDTRLQNLYLEIGIVKDERREE